MAQFSYEAKTKQGIMRKGKIEALDESAAMLSLRKIDVYPISIKPYKESIFNVDLAEYRKVSLKDIYIFCREFSYIISAGIGIVRVLEILKQQTENPRLRRVISNVSDSVQKGESLSSSMEKYSEFPGMLVNMIAVGENSGKLDETMLRMANYYESENRQHQKVQQALTYPAVLSILAIVVVNFLVIKVLPTFINNSLQNGVAEKDLPMPTKVVMGASNFMIGYWYIILALIVFGILMSKLLLKGKENVNIDKLKLDIPVFGNLNKKIVFSRFARTFGMLISTGVPVVKSIEISSKIIQNAYVRDLLLRAKIEIEKGAGIGDTLQSYNTFPVMLVQMIKIGEESGTMDSVLTKTAEFYDGEIETATAELTTMIEPAIIVVLGFVIGFIIVSVIMPMFQMYDAMAH